MTDHLERASETWERLYAEGHRLEYPSDVFVRITHHLFQPDEHSAVYDHGCGSGENLLHLARRGFVMTGGDVSSSAVEITRQRAEEAGLDVDVHVLDTRTLPFADDAFDAAFAWQVLTYHTPETLRVAIAELRRVVRPGGALLLTLSAPGDYMHVHGEPVGDDVYDLSAVGQEGSTIMIVPEDRIGEFFPDTDAEVGWFGHDFGDRPSRHWLVSLVC